MFGKHWKHLTLSVIAMSLATQTWAAGSVTKIETSSTTAALNRDKATLKFTVGGTVEDTESCGLWIDYGDGSNPDTRIVSKDEGMFPRAFEHTFTKPGGYSIKARGQRVKQTFGCSGSAETFVTVTASAGATRAAAAAAAQPSCPDGWQLATRSYNQRTGEFSCSAKPPVSRLECGPGLSYYENGGLIGCRRR